MENIRCLLADIPHRLLAEIIQKITDKQPGIKVVKYINERKDIRQEISDQSIDVVIFGMQQTEVPESMNEILDYFQQVVAVGVVDDGRRIYVCIDDVGPGDLVELVKTAMKKRLN